jgi:hypothetical protein
MCLEKVDGNMCMNKTCFENGVFFVNDLISENKMFFFTYEEFMSHYNIRLNFTWLWVPFQSINNVIFN